MNTIIDKINAAASSLARAVSAHPAPARNVVLVHGASTDETSWDEVARLLRGAGCTVTPVRIPLSSLQADIAAAREAIAAQQGAIVLVGHSWGGVVIGETGNDPNVSALVYVAAFAPDRGESIQKLSSNSPASAGQQALRPDARGFLSIDPTALPAVFAGDLPADRAESLVAHQQPINAAAFESEASVAAWHDKPTFYAVSADDLMLPAQAQLMFAQRMNARTVTLQSSHASPVSHPADIAALIELACREIAETGAASATDTADLRQEQP